MRRRTLLLSLLLALLLPATASARQTSSVEATSLSVSRSGEQVTLTWAVNSTTNLLGFLIEQRLGAGSWTKLPWPVAGGASARSATIKLGPGEWHVRLWPVVKVGSKEKAVTVPATPPPPPTTETTPPPLPPPPPPPSEPHEQTTWGAASELEAPLTDAQAASCVGHKAEIRPDNAPFNVYVPSEAELAAFRKGAEAFPSRLNTWVTGQAALYLTNPSTDDLLQWAACKWRVPTETMRAFAVKESWWHHFDCGSSGKPCNSSGGPEATGVKERGFGDCNSNLITQPSAAYHAPGCTTAAYNSIGLMQIKEQGSKSPHPGTEPLRWKSTAFNIDYMASKLRYYYDGLCTWCSPGYVKGQIDPTIGAWFSPSPWNNSSAVSFTSQIHQEESIKRWTTSAFASE